MRKTARRAYEKPEPLAKKVRKAGPYQKRYGREFKKLAPKYKLKSGKWGKDGFKRTQAAAHRATKKALK